MHLASADVADRYVGFLDVLGFGRMVQDDYAVALKRYNELLDAFAIVRQAAPQYSVRMFSDSMLIVSSDLVGAIVACNALLHAALFADFMLRGAICFGPHIEKASGDDMIVVSDPLVRAVGMEKALGMPRVVVDRAIPIPSVAWDPETRNILRKLIYYEDRWLVNPFNVMWGRSAATRVTQLRDRYPEHKAKYDWFLGLFDAVMGGRPLVPRAMEPGVEA